MRISSFLRLSLSSHLTVPIFCILAWGVFLRPATAQINTTPPAATQRLVFIHHSTGYAWLSPDEGGLITELNRNNYYVCDTDYDWGPYDADVNDGSNIGSHTDIGHWHNWFLGPHRATYLQALYTNTSTDHANDENLHDPGGENRIVMFKSCFTSAQAISGNPTDPPLAPGVPNPLNGIGVGDDWDGSRYSVANIKGLYRDLLGYFQTRPDKLFILVTTPPTHEGSADEAMPKLRAINNWLTRDLLNGYPLDNVFVFDYYTVLTSNGGSPTVNDFGAPGGGHHRVWNGAIQHLTGSSNFLAYATWDDGSSSWDDHPTPQGHQKAAGEFVPLLNNAYNKWTKNTAAPGESEAPASIAIESLAPNPLSSQSVIRLSGTGGNGAAALEVHDILGRKILDLTGAVQADAVAGGTSVRLHRGSFPAAGVYLLSLRSAAGMQVRKLVVR